MKESGGRKSFLLSALSSKRKANGDLKFATTFLRPPFCCNIVFLIIQMSKVNRENNQQGTEVKQRQLNLNAADATTISLL